LIGTYGSFRKIRIYASELATKCLRRYALAHRLTKENNDGSYWIIEHYVLAFSATGTLYAD